MEKTNKLIRVAPVYEFWLNLLYVLDKIKQVNLRDKGISIFTPPTPTQNLKAE